MNDRQAASIAAGVAILLVYEGARWEKEGQIDSGGRKHLTNIAIKICEAFDLPLPFGVRRLD